MNTKRIILSFILALCVCFHAEVKGNPSIRFGVMKFFSRAEGVTEQQATTISCNNVLICKLELDCIHCQNTTFASRRL